MRKVVLPLVLTAGLVLALEYITEPEQTIVWKTLFDLGHAPLFGIVALQLRKLVVAVRGPAPERQRSLEAFILAVGVGIATEIVQLFQPGRDASASDVVRDAAGAAAFLLVRHAARSAPGTPPGGQRPRRAALLTAAFLLLAAVGAPFIVAMALYRERDNAMPTLYALDGSWWERRLISGRHARLVPASAGVHPDGAAGFPLTRLELEPGKYAGLVFSEPYPNWSGYTRLAFTIRSDLATPITLTLRIHDLGHNQRYEDRFNRDITVTPGEHQVTIGLDEIGHAPKGRQLDLTRIRGIVLFAYRLDRPAHIYLGSLRLK
jgi:hypothetical protein